MVLLAPLVVLFVAAFLYLPVSSDFETINDNGSSRVLLLTAHPDDEAMFFAPTLLTLTAKPPAVQAQQDDSSGQAVFSSIQGGSASQVYSLCLSNGNADGLGTVREQELTESLNILGVTPDNRWIVDNPELQDNITLNWDPLVIANVIKPYIIEHRISTILTFDYKGVSNHPNHRALPEGVKHLLKSLPDGTAKPRLFTLISVPKSGKYISIMAPVMAKFDLYASKTLLYYETLITKGLERAEIIPPGSAAPSQINRKLMPVFVSGIPEFRTTFEAMLAHKSQMEWFRWLYLFFSRYMWINEWTEVKL